MSHRSRGICALLGFAFLAAAADVYAGNQFQSISPVAVAATSFSIGAVIFLGAELGCQGTGDLRRFRARRATSSRSTSQRH